MSEVLKGANIFEYLDLIQKPSLRFIQDEQQIRNEFETRIAKWPMCKTMMIVWSWKYSHRSENTETKVREDSSQYIRDGINDNDWSVSQIFEVNGLASYSQIIDLKVGMINCNISFNSFQSSLKRISDSKLVYVNTMMMVDHLVAGCDLCQMIYFSKDEARLQKIVNWITDKTTNLIRPKLQTICSDYFFYKKKPSDFSYVELFEDYQFALE